MGFKIFYIFLKLALALENDSDLLEDHWV